MRCAGKGYDFCDDCANQYLEEECDFCDEGDNFESVEEDFAGANIQPLRFMRFMRMKEAA